MPLRKIRILPRDDATNGWSRILPHRRPRPHLTDRVEADWLVIGAGYAGLSAARRLAETRPGDAISLLEAGIAGENASGRNSGFAIGLPHNVGTSLAELDGAHRYMRLARAAIDHLGDLVERHGIACDWSRAGKYHAAVSARGRADVLVPHARELEALGEPFEWLDRSQIEARLGTPYYHAALYTPGSVLLNPAALTRGLADTLPPSVALYEQSPVVEIETGPTIRAVTPEGQVTAPRLILAVNGFAEQFGVLPGRLLNYRAHASLTRPMTADEQASLKGERAWGLTPANAFVSVTMRRTQDQRILVRHGLAYRPSLRVEPSEMALIRDRHLAILRQRFPMLPDLSIAHSWTGFVAVARNGAPGFGAVTPNIWSAVGCNAVGVTKSTMSGLLIADLATGRDNPLIADMQSLGRPQALPPEPLRSVGVHLHNRYELWRTRHEA
ncbi:MAG: FAD-binding oxidoreductase [Hyphomicrobiaceae bacterium]